LRQAAFPAALNALCVTPLVGLTRDDANTRMLPPREKENKGDQEM